MKDRLLAALLFVTCFAAIATFVMHAVLTYRVIALNNHIILIEKRVETECKVKP